MIAYRAVFKGSGDAFPSNSPERRLRSCMCFASESGARKAAKELFCHPDPEDDIHVEEIKAEPYYASWYEMESWEDHEGLFFIPPNEVGPSVIDLFARHFMKGSMLKTVRRATAEEIELLRE
jgi:hypothetical protein